MRFIIVLGLTFIFFNTYGQNRSADQELPQWKNGMLDIHFINTGRGNASFIVMPDGTTMLIDAGDMNKAKFEKTNLPLKMSPAFPNDLLRPGEWIAAYIRQVMPKNRNPAIDYALITHFHEDHYGNIEENSPVAIGGAYQLSGITDVGTLIPVHQMIDRGYPDYDYPLDLRKYYRDNKTFQNYLAFITDQQAYQGMKVATLTAGSDQQVTLLFKRLDYPNFSVRNIKSNGSIWSGKGVESTDYLSKMQFMENGKFNENPLSNAIKIIYGPFTYYTGGDNTGYEGKLYPGRKDAETPMAKVVGHIEAMSLNHHGNRDATNEEFLETLSPETVVEQSWCSDQPGQEVAFRLTQKKADGDSVKIFTTYMQPETKTYMGFWIEKAFKSLQGHVLIRVLNGGEQYLVYVLDDKSLTLSVGKVFGPFTVHKTN